MKVKNLFLFGAGASFGSGGLNNQIPLGENLFINLKINFNNSWGRLPSDFNNIFETDFETGMEVVWKDPAYSRSIPYLMRDMAIFFSYFFIVDIKKNFYIRIIERIRELKILECTTLSTINYDLLIECALEINNIKINYEEENKDGIVFHKLHGSCNFILDPNMLKAKKGSIFYGAGPKFNTDKIVIIKRDQVKSYCNGNTALYPCMAIYKNDKVFPMGEGALGSIQKIWQNKLKEAENIFIIGVRPNLADKHIWDFLNNKERIHFCGDHNQFLNWQKDKNRKDEFLGDTFEESYNNIIKIIN